SYFFDFLSDGRWDHAFVWFGKIMKESDWSMRYVPESFDGYRKHLKYSFECLQ
ncbi:hypothetical protein IQC45_21755, partial [Leptospira interrogans serovar Pomona]|nr:hypothetical protein [Leptospira interrogans serovar Pomona]